MKKSIFIIVGILFVLLLISVWVYLLFFGTPQTADEVFTKLGLSGEEDTTYIPPVIIDEDSTVINMARPKLRQLTTKPVAGFREISLGTSTPEVLIYVERGTGHVFSINLTSGVETRISGKTVPETNRAVISSSGNFVAISAFGNTKNMDLVVGEISTSSEFFIEKFNESVQDFSLGKTDELLFTKTNEQGLVAYSYNLKSGATKNIFSLPFHEAIILWGESSNDTHHAYPKTSYYLEGSLYEVSADKLLRLPLAGFGFGAKVSENFVLYNTNSDQTTTSYIYDRQTQENTLLDSPIILEKCFLPTKGYIFVCGFEAIKVSEELPDAWYRGDVSFKDSIFALSASKIVSEELVNTFAESGREIDIINTVMNDRNSAIYFTNKNDNSLWMYEI